MHKCIHESEPDIIILNETWLKPSILNSEIIPNNMYKVFRCNRSNYTHPIDTSNPNKFRRNGGGILIAIKSSLLLTTNKINKPVKSCNSRGTNQFLHQVIAIGPLEHRKYNSWPRKLGGHA